MSSFENEWIILVKVGHIFFINFLQKFQYHINFLEKI